VIQSGFIEALSIGYQDTEDRAQLQQLMPISVITCQSRSIETQHQSGLAQANLSDEALKAVALGTGGTGLAQIVVDYGDTLARPSERYCAVYQMILELCALLMLANLTRCRLTYVDIG